MKYLLILFTCISFGQFNPIFFASNKDKTGLIAYYKFDSNGNDFATGSHNGTSANMNYANAGKVSTCATFNGSSSYVEVPQSTDFDFSGVTDKPFSISVWVNLGTPTGYGNIVGKGGGSIPQWYLRKGSVTNTFLEMVLISSPSNYKLWVTPSLTVSTWYHVVFTYDGSGTDAGMKFYLDNTLTALTNSNVGTYTKMSTTTQPLHVGKRVDNVNYYNGKIDELAIYRNKVLTVGEINTLYTNGLAGIPIL